MHTTAVLGLPVAVETLGALLAALLVVWIWRASVSKAHPSSNQYVSYVRTLPKYPDGASEPGGAELLRMRKTMFVEDQVEAYERLCSPPLDRHPVGLLVVRANVLARAASLPTPGIGVILDAFQDVVRVCASRHQDPESNQFWENWAMVLFMHGNAPEGFSVLARSERADIEYVKREHSDVVTLGQYTYVKHVWANSAGFRDVPAQRRFMAAAKAIGLS